MNLENIEQQCFNFLQQTSSPIVPVSTLLRRLAQEEEFAGLSEHELLDFLRHNPLFVVIDPGPQDVEMVRDLTEAGIAAGPRVLLKARVPTPAEYSQAMNEQMETMINALGKALAKAEKDEEHATIAELNELLAKANRLREELSKLFQE